MAKNRQNKVSVITLGCSKNTVDSERLMKQLNTNRFELIEDPKIADTIIINTCGFIESAKNESIETILKAVALKKSGAAKKIVVAGCLSERYKNELVIEIPEVDAFFGTEKYEEIIQNLGGNFKHELLGERILTTPNHTAYLKISEGCDHPCSFCAIPLMRGLHKSKPMNDLIHEASILADYGVKEIIIIGQDTTDYGKDLYGKRNLAELLEKITNIDGIQWVRIMYAYPSHFPEDVIDVIANNEKICKYLDIPLQHISDDVLKSMRRGITSNKTKQLIETLRAKIPDLVLRTTLIAGYPAEKEKHFEELCDFVHESKFDKLGVFPYSQEENTSSFILGDPIPAKVKHSRVNTLMKIQKKISIEKNKQLLKKKLNVLVEGRENGFFVGRSYRDAPEIDGEVLIPAVQNLNLGSFYNVEIYDYDDYDVFGKLIQ
ncbi:MAG: 30S ribosomal protein S12 methylthiotransferase RimO [Ignavibacteriaceae bacterium]|nr:30S ribosomal protein S12 methylthiotransferase RimO [Ignavibacteriaceae bacterium]